MAATTRCGGRRGFAQAPVADTSASLPRAPSQVYVRKRPHLDKFLQWIAGRFEVIIFTASQQVYAERLLDLLDPDHKYIK